VSYSVYGGKDADTIDVVQAINSTLQGSKGDDTIGTNTVAGSVKVTSSLVYGGADNDKIYFGEVTGSTVQGSAGADTLTMKTGDSILSKINGGADNDTILIEAAVGEISKGSTLNGNKGADKITIEDAVTIDEITVFGGAGNDTINAGANQTTISGDLGSDIIKGHKGDKTSVSGGDGNDTITNGGAGTQTVNGGEGIDAVALDSTGVNTLMAGRTASAAATAVNYQNGANGALKKGDTITFANGIDVVTGLAATDKIGAELNTTAANISYWGETAGGADKVLVNGANGAITWNDVNTEAGQTFAIAGTYDDAGKFTLNGDVDADHLLIIQGSGSSVEVGTSAFILDAVALGTAISTNIADGSAFTNFIG